jgi:large subunit ribosomal protein L15
MAIALNTLKPAKGANRKNKRVGRGMGSGHGKTATRGYKGQKSRSGSSVRPGFEGGQMPLHRRLPKRGFTNIFRKEFAVVNLSDLAELAAGTHVEPEMLKAAGIIKKLKDGVKILGEGDLQHALHIRAHRFSTSAAEKIQKAGGTVEVIS